jgi:hypothetical protein
MYFTTSKSQQKKNKLDFFLLRQRPPHPNQAWINPSHCLASDYDLKSNNDIILETTDQNDTPRQKPPHDVVDASLLPWEVQMNVSRPVSKRTFLGYSHSEAPNSSFHSSVQSKASIAGETITRRFAKDQD